MLNSYLEAHHFDLNTFSEILFEDIPMCEIYQNAKFRKKATRGKMSGIYPALEGDLKTYHLQPGVLVPVDHFESIIKSKTFRSFGQSTSKRNIP